MTVQVIMRAAPVATFEELSEPESVQHVEMFDRGALKPRLGCDPEDVPLFLDHANDGPAVGHVTAMYEERDPTGGRGCGSTPPSWLSTRTGVSVSRSAYRTRNLGAGWELVTGALLTEVSLLPPGVEPQFPRARVDWIGEPKDSSPVRSSDRAGGEVLDHPE